MKLWTFRCACVMALALAGCLFPDLGDDPSSELPDPDPEPDPPGSPGVFGHGTFIYECVDDRDAECEGSPAYGGHFPDLGLGGLFDMRYETEQETTKAILVRGDHVIPEGSAYFAAREGHSAVFAMSGGTVHDLIHVEIRPVEDVLINREDGNYLDELEIEAGAASFWLIPTPITSFGVILAGSMEYRWASGDEEILRHVSGPTVFRGIFKPLQPGQTHVTVETGDVVRTIPVTVVEAPPDTDTDTDGGSGTGETGTSGTGETGTSGTGETGTSGTGGTGTSGTGTGTSGTGTGTDTGTESGTGSDSSTGGAP